jgi:hypothetical protein
MRRKAIEIRIIPGNAAPRTWRVLLGGSAVIAEYVEGRNGEDVVHAELAALRYANGIERVLLAHGVDVDLVHQESSGARLLQKNEKP